MANPFDEFDAPQANPFDEFDEEKSSGLKIPTAVKNFVGGNEAVGSMALSLPSYIGGGLAGLGTLLTTGNPEAAADVQKTIQEKYSVDPYTKAGKQVQEMLGEGLDTLKSTVGNAGGDSAAGRTLLEAGTEAALNFLPIPGGKLVRKGGKAIERALEKKSPADAVLAKQAELDAAKKQPANPFDEFDKQPQQTELFSPEDQPRGANQYEAQAGDWRVDENGIPIRADLSMEAQNLQSPLQRNLWGDELPTRENPVGQAAALPMDRDIFGHEQLTRDAKMTPENDIPLTQAIDSMPDLPWRGPRDEAIDRLRGEIPADGPLEAAKMAAESPFVPKGQRGAINPAVFKEGFEKLKQLADGTWLRAYADGRGLTVEARKDGHILAESTFDKPRDITDNLTANFTASDKKGMSKEMYTFVAELGNDVQRSGTQTKAGKGMWDSFERDGVSKDGVIKSPGNKQLGALRIGEKKQKQMEKVAGKQDNLIPKDPDVKSVLTEAQAEGRDGKGLTYAESGSTLTAMKRRSALVLGGSRLVQNAEKRADLAIKQHVLPAEDAIRKLAPKEVESLVDLLQKEAARGERFDGEALSLLPVKQQVAYAHFREMMDNAMRIQNEKRVAAGKEPVTALEAYTSHRWEGDFRRPVFQAVLDRNGNPKIKPDGSIERKLVWYLAAHTKRGLEKQWEALSKEHPDLAFDPKEDHTVRFYKRQTDLQSAYTTMLDIIGRDDPAVAKLKEAVEAQTVNEAASFLAQEKHFKTQTGVRGYVGDRPGKGGPSEALAFMQQQINYAKNSFKWSEMQTAGEGIKELISDPTLKQEQPHNVEYVKEYFKSAVGYGEAKAISHMQDAVRDLGVSPALIDKGVGGMKSFFVLQKLGINLGYGAVSLLQSANVLPHLIDQWASKRTAGNPITAMSMGIAGGMAMAAGHYIPFLKSIGGSIADQNFYKQAFRYAEDNGVSARSMYDEAPIDSSFSAPGRIGHAVGLTLTIPEVVSRSVAYMSFVQALREGGKYKNTFDTKGNFDYTALFQRAEELTNAAMVDYRTAERPLVFEKLGIAGNAANVFQTFPLNWYNTLNYFARESMRGNVGPMVTFLMLQYALAGAMGVPGFDDADKLYGFVRDHLPAQQYAKLKESPFWSDPKLWMLENFGDAAVYGALSDKSGIGFTSRVSAPGAGQMIQAPGGPLIDLGKQAYNLADAATSVDNKTKWAQFAMGSVPSGQQGRLEQAPFMEGSTFEKNPNTGNRIYQRPGDIADHKGVYERTPGDETLRSYGLRSQEEVVNREIGYRTDRANRISTEKARTIPDAVFDALKRNDVEKAKDLSQAYTKLTGEAFDWNTMSKQAEDSMTTAVQRQQMAAKTTAQLLNATRMKKMIDKIKEEQSK